jgi:hypothetical protein
MLQNIGHCQYLPMFCNTLYQCVSFLAYSRDLLVFVSNGNDDNDLDPAGGTAGEVSGNFGLFRNWWLAS